MGLRARAKVTCLLQNDLGRSYSYIAEVLTRILVCDRSQSFFRYFYLLIILVHHIVCIGVLGTRAPSRTVGKQTRSFLCHF
jgi:hypothetical protein